LEEDRKVVHVQIRVVWGEDLGAVGLAMRTRVDPVLHSTDIDTQLMMRVDHVDGSQPVLTA
jgi:hypothetical protein